MMFFGGKFFNFKLSVLLVSKMDNFDHNYPPQLAIILLIQI